MRLVPWKSGNANAVCVCVIAMVLGQFGAPVTGSAGAARESQEAEQKTPAAEQPTSKPAQTLETPRRASIPPGPNVRVELTIIDQAGSEAPVKKTLSVIAASGFNGSVRSMVSVAVPGPEGSPVKTFRYQDLPLNVDVRPEVVENGRIRTRLVLNYETFNAAAEGRGAAVRSVVTVDQWVMLENGRPTNVSQSADAATDRKVSIELTATILK